MTQSSVSLPKAHSIGLILALSTILFGFLLGMVFGAAESDVKGLLKSRGESVLATVYEGDVAAKDAVVAKSWEYMKRAHLHGGAIGAAALVAICVLLLVGATDRAGQLTAVALGFGGLLYALFWLVAGLQAPILGSTSEAKESLKIIAMPGAGLSILGICGTIYAVIRRSWASAS